MCTSADWTPAFARETGVDKLTFSPASSLLVCGHRTSTILPRRGDRITRLCDFLGECRRSRRGDLRTSVSQNVIPTGGRNLRCRAVAMGSFQLRGEYWKTRILDSSLRNAAFGMTGVEVTQGSPSGERRRWGNLGIGSVDISRHSGQRRPLHKSPKGTTWGFGIGTIKPKPPSFWIPASAGMTVTQRSLKARIRFWYRICSPRGIDSRFGGKGGKCHRHQGSSDSDALTVTLWLC